MKTLLQTPITLKIKIIGPKDLREIDTILDTGARYTTISWQVLEDIGYDPARTPKKVSIITANGIIEAPLLKIKEITIGEIKVNNVEVVCLDVPELVGIEGLLGLSVLDKMKTEIDYKNKILEIQDP
jgi:clan AA aspartic protease (TIGR02281 family)